MVRDRIVTPTTPQPRRVATSVLNPYCTNVLMCIETRAYRVSTRAMRRIGWPESYVFRMLVPTGLFPISGGGYSAVVTAQT